MRRPSKFNIAAGLSLIMFVGGVVAYDYTMDRRQSSGPFPLNGQMWEILYGAGQVTLRNQPQVDEEGDEVGQALSRVTHVFLQKSRDIFRALKVLKRDTPLYREKVAEYATLEAAYSAERSRLLPAGLTTPVEHTFPLWPELLLWATLPTAQLIVILYRRPLARRELRRPLTMVAVAQLLIAGGVLLLQLRSYYAGLTWEYSARPTAPQTPPDPSRKSQAWIDRLGLVVFRGKVQCYQDIGPTYQSYTAAGYSRTSHLFYDLAPLRGRQMPGVAHWDLPGIAYAAEQPRLDSRGHILHGYHKLDISPEYVIAIFLVYPFLRLREIRRARRGELRLMNNQCVNCGYQLTGIAGGVCPECGAAKV